MATCDVCGRQEDMPYTCHYCGGSYCAEHRLPENHDCSGLDEWDDPSGVFDSGFGGSARDAGGRESAFPSAGPGGLLGYFRGNVTYLFLALMWVTFFLQFALGRLVSRELAATLFVLSSTHPEYVWTWVMAVFAHGSPGHILINSIVLYFFGPIVERRVGTRAFVLSLTIRLVPELRARYRTIEEAQRSRGLVYEGGPFAKARARMPVFIPFFVAVVRYGYELGEALEVRGYGRSGRRTYQVGLTFGRADALLALFAVAVLAGFGVVFLRLP